MQEKTLLKIALLMALLGLVILYFYSTELDLKAIENLNTASLEQEIKIRGIVQRLSFQDKVIFFTVSGQRTETLDVVVFEDEPLFLKEGDLVEVTGILEEYQGKKEVIASSVVLK